MGNYKGFKANYINLTLNLIVLVYINKYCLILISSASEGD
ncbi:hypothetical protein BX659_11433 [Orenia metallireducens]|jgi:hypothetical protein|nr:hypothetical protein BX659_11433 [Orenia metallireducens]